MPKRFNLLCAAFVASVLSLSAMVVSAQEAALGHDKKSLFSGDALRGQSIAGAVCIACHGADGNGGGGTNPKLAGLNAAYIYKQLNQFVSPASQADPDVRPNAVMWEQVSKLSDEDKRGLAVWFSQQKSSDNVARNKASFALGQKIWRAGIASKGVPACAACHGATGAGIPTQYPRLAGQHAEYADAQMKAFRAGTRKNAAKMVDIAKNMTDAEIAAVVDYAAGLRSNVAEQKK